jgi:uncharacterized membrane protein
VQDHVDAETDPASTPATTDGPVVHTDTTDANLVAIALEGPILAQEALLAAMRLQAKGQLKLEDAAIVAKEAGGKVRVQETKDITTAQGAISGSWWGLLGGILVGGPAALVGLAVGAAAGGIFAKLRDIGIQDEDIAALGEELAEGEAALLLLVEHAHVFHAVAELRRFAGRLLRTTCDPATAERMSDALTHNPWSTDF